MLEPVGSQCDEDGVGAGVGAGARRPDLVQLVEFDSVVLVQLTVGADEPRPALALQHQRLPNTAEAENSRRRRSLSKNIGIVGPYDIGERKIYEIRI